MFVACFSVYVNYVLSRDCMISRKRKGVRARFVGMCVRVSVLRAEKERGKMCAGRERERKREKERERERRGGGGGGGEADIVAKLE